MHIVEYLGRRASLEEAKRKLSPKALETLRTLAEKGPLVLKASRGRNTYNFTWYKAKGGLNRVKGIYMPTLDRLEREGLVRDVELRNPKGVDGHAKWPFQEPVVEITDKGREVVSGKPEAKKKGSDRVVIEVLGKGSTKPSYVKKAAKGYGAKGVKTTIYRDEARSFRQKEAESLADDMRAAKGIRGEPRWPSVKIVPA